MRVTCSCGKVLRVESRLIGKRIRCPGCKEPLLIEDEVFDDDESADDQPTSKASTRKKSRQDTEDDGDDTDDDEAYERKKKKKKKKPKASVLNTRNLVAGGVLIACLVALGVILIVRLSGSKEADNALAKGQKAPDSPPKKNTPAPPGKVSLGNGDPALEKMASRLIGRWLENEGNSIYDYRADGTFTLAVKKPPRNASGNWKVVGIGADSAKLERTGEGQPSEYFKPNDSPLVYFQGEDELLHGNTAGTNTVRYRRETPRSPAEKKPEDTTLTAAEVKIHSPLMKILGPEWSSFVSNEGGFTVLLPGRPQRGSDPNVPGGGTVYAFLKMEGSPDVLFWNDTRSFAEFRKAIEPRYGALTAEYNKSREIKTDKFVGFETQWKYRDEKHPRWAYVLLSNRRAFVLTWQGPEEKVRAFFDSFLLR